MASGRPYDSFGMQYIPNAEAMNRTFNLNGMDMNVIHQGLKGAPTQVEYNWVKLNRLKHPQNAFAEVSQSITGRCARGTPSACSPGNVNSQNKTMGGGPNRTFYARDVMSYGRSY